MYKSWDMLTSGKREPQEPVKGVGREKIQRLYRRSITLSLGRGPHGPSSGIWTCRSRVVRKQPNEYGRWDQVACTGKHQVWLEL